MKTKEYLRYRFDGSGLLQNQEKLRAWCNCLPEGMRLQKIDRGWFERCREKEWMRDFVSQYQSLKEYHSTAGGWLLLAGEQPVSGASCYLCFPSRFCHSGADRRAVSGSRICQNRFRCADSRRIAVGDFTPTGMRTMQRRRHWRRLWATVYSKATQR